MALLSLPLPLDVIAWVTGDDRWWELSRACIGAGLASAFVAAIAGLVDLAAIGANAAASRTANRHLIVMLVATVLFAIDGWLRLPAAVPEGATRVAAVVLSVAGMLTLAFGGWLGGELIHRHRVGQTNDAQ